MTVCLVGGNGSNAFIARRWASAFFTPLISISSCCSCRQRRSVRRLPRAFHLDRLLVFAFLALQLLAAYTLTGFASDLKMPRWLIATVGVFLPWVTWIWFMGFVSFLQHTHPRTAWYDDEAEWSFYHVQLRSTTHVTFPWPIERLLHNIMDHPAHHIDPTIPLYELPASQKLLEERAAGTLRGRGLDAARILADVSGL